MITAKKIALIVGGTIDGNVNSKIKGTADLEQAKNGDISFLFDKKYVRAAEKSKASVILTFEDINMPSKTLIKVKNPRLAMAKVLELFQKPVKFTKKNFAGKNTVIYPSASIGANVKIGSSSIIYPNVTIYPNSEIGSNVIIHAGAVIGSDGFGYVQDKGKWTKIPQIGKVVIEDDVEIGANTAIDRATFGETRIKRGTKIDNLTHIAHNCIIGEDCAITAGITIAGSAVVGNRVQMGGQVGLRDHVKIGSDTIIIGKSGVTKDIPPKSVVSGFPAQNHQKEMEIQAHKRRIPELFKRVAEIEKKLNK